MSELEGYGQFNNPRLIYNLGTRPSSSSSRAGARRHPPVPLLAPQERHRRGEDAYEEAMPHQAPRVRRAVRQVPQGPVKPFREKSAGRLRHEPGPEPREDQVTAACSRSSPPPPATWSPRRRASARLQARHHPDLDQGRRGHPQPHPGLLREPGLRVHHRARPTLEHGALDVVVTQGGPARLLCAHREAAQPDRAERRHRDIEQRVELKAVDLPESPDFSPDGRSVVFSGLQKRDWRHLADRPGEWQPRESDEGRFADYAPTYSPDGSFIVYVARISGKRQAVQARRRIGTRHSSPSAPTTMRRRSSSMATRSCSRRQRPIEHAGRAEVARNGNIYNLWTLDLKSGELRQWTIPSRETCRQS